MGGHIDDGETALQAALREGFEESGLSDLELLSVERQQRSHARRSGLFEQLEKSFGRHFYDDKTDAVDTARRRAATREQARNGERPTDQPDAETSPEPNAIF